MFWIVQKDHPKPETYIPIFIRKAIRDTPFTDVKKFAAFSSEKAALKYATELKNRFGLGSIRLFYEEGHSQKVKI